MAALAVDRAIRYLLFIGGIFSLLYCIIRMKVFAENNMTGDKTDIIKRYISVHFRHWN